MGTLFIGNFGRSGIANCGQSIKTKLYFDVINKERRDIFAFDTSRLKRNFGSAAVLFMRLFFTREAIIMPAQSMLPILCVILPLFRIKVTYIVIGGWLPEYMVKRNWLIRPISKFKIIVVETEGMRSILKTVGIESHVIPNMKPFKINQLYSSPSPSPSSASKVIPNKTRFIFISRVERTKGVLNAIEALSHIADRYPQRDFSLDIFGVLDESFSDEFYLALKTTIKANLNIQYKGFVKTDLVQGLLKDYSFLIFPTYYKGEGFPGVLVDAFSAGVPIISSDWKYNSEILTDSVNSFVFKAKDNKDLYRKLELAINISREDYLSMSNSCFKSSIFYHISQLKPKLAELSII